MNSLQYSGQMIGKMDGAVQATHEELLAIAMAILHIMDFRSALQYNKHNLSAGLASPGPVWPVFGN